jgi:O-acetyl-ADP-ribose deacetylase (regulator of RNase III)
MFKPYAEGKMTPKVLSTGDKYKGTCSNMMDAANSSGSGDGGLTMSTKRKTLKEALHIRNKCQVRNSSRTAVLTLSQKNLLKFF